MTVQVGSDVAGSYINSTGLAAFAAHAGRLNMRLFRVSDPIAKVFEITGLTPGTYSLKVESEAVEAGKLDDVQVAEDVAVDVTLRMVRGATLRVRATNVDKQRIPFAQMSLYDGRGNLGLAEGAWSGPADTGRIVDLAASHTGPAPAEKRRHRSRPCLRTRSSEPSPSLRGPSAPA